MLPYFSLTIIYSGPPLFVHINILPYTSTFYLVQPYSTWKYENSPSISHVYLIIYVYIKWVMYFIL